MVNNSPKKMDSKKIFSWDWYVNIAYRGNFPSPQNRPPYWVSSNLSNPTSWKELLFHSPRFGWHTPRKSLFLSHKNGKKCHSISEPKKHQIEKLSLTPPQKSTHPPLSLSPLYYPTRKPTFSLKKLQLSPTLTPWTHSSPHAFLRQNRPASQTSPHHHSHPLVGRITTRLSHSLSPHVNRLEWRFPCLFVKSMLPLCPDLDQRMIFYLRQEGKVLNELSFAEVKAIILSPATVATENRLMYQWGLLEPAHFPQIQMLHTSLHVYGFC